MEKAYSLGIMVGRFQTLHIGHTQMIRKAIELCDEVGIFIGSSQEFGTAKNPFSYEMRKALICDIFGESVKVFPLPDIGVGNVPEWGEYVLKNVFDNFSQFPDLFISGKEERRAVWLAGETGKAIDEIYISNCIAENKGPLIAICNSPASVNSISI